MVAGIRRILQTAKMPGEPHGATSGEYAARIPASFIDPQWDLMYFVEIADARGHGRIYPDLDTETPYRVVSVKR